MSKKYYLNTSANKGSRYQSTNRFTTLLGLAVAVTFTFASCADNSETLTDSGYHYELLRDVDGKAGNPGDYVYLDIEMVADETQMFDTRDNPSEPEPMRLPPEGEVLTGHMRPIVEVISMMSPGDSAMLEIPIDSFVPVPKQLAQFKTVKYYFAVTDIKDEASYNKDFDDKQAANKQVQEDWANTVAQIYADYKSGALDDKIIETPDGLQYLIIEEGSGPTAAKGETVTVHYYGVFAENGEMFDTSWRMGRPFSFPLGEQQVIQGWDEGFALLKKGAKAVLFVPTELAYGETGYPPIIAPNTDLIFYVELLDIN